MFWITFFFDPPDVHTEPGVSDKIPLGITLAFVLKIPDVATNLMNTDSQSFIGTLEVVLNFRKTLFSVIWAKTFFDPPDVQPEPGISDKITHGIPLAYILKNPGVVTDLLNNDSRGFIGTLEVGPKSRIFEKLDFL